MLSLRDIWNEIDLKELSYNLVRQCLYTIDLVEVVVVVERLNGEAALQYV